VTDRLSRSPLLATLGVALGLMLSPESLVTLGKSAGKTGIAVVPLVFMAMTVHLLTATSYDELNRRLPGPAGEIRLLRGALGAVPAAALLLCSRFLFVLCAAPLILATAGYVFNEVFLDWFPNLGFSFLLLSLLLVVNLVGRRAALAAQVTLVAVSLLAMIGLIAAGVLGHSSLQSQQTWDQGGGLSHSGFLLLFLFMGYDLAATALPDQQSGRRRVRAISTGVVLIALLFAAWGFLSASFVAPARLAASTVPHLMAARAILGDTGRGIMGTAVLAGSAAAVNVLFFSVPRIMAAMAKEGLLPSRLSGSGGEPRLAVLFVASGPAAMMALGMAGKQETEIYARAAFLFWLLLYGAVDFCLLYLRRSQHLSPPVGTLVSFFAMMASVVAILISDAQGVQLLGLMVVIALLSVAGVAGIRKKGEANRCCGNSPCMMDAKRPGRGDSPICPAGAEEMKP